jgi:hypothetical protein
MNLRVALIALAAAAVSLASVAAGTPTLTAAEAIRLANEAAKKEGYKLREYQAPEAHYEFTRKDDTWFISYEGKPDKNGNTALGHHFGVRIHDKTRKVDVFQGR